LIAQAMPDVQFEEQNFRDPRYMSVQNKTPKMVGFLLRMGWAKNDKQANYILIGISICAFALTFIVLFF